MSIEESNMWQCMNFCNGEIRVMAGRYGGGWLAAGCAVIEWDFNEKWEDLVCGDNDYFEARDFFKRNNDIILIEFAATPREAFDACVTKLANASINRPIFEYKAIDSNE